MLPGNLLRALNIVRMASLIKPSSRVCVRDVNINPDSTQLDPTTLLICMVDDERYYIRITHPLPEQEAREFEGGQGEIILTPGLRGF